MTSETRAREMRYGREYIDRKIIDLRHNLDTADDQLEIALLKLAIESFETEKASLLPASGHQMTDEAKVTEAKTGVDP